MAVLRIVQIMLEDGVSAVAAKECIVFVMLASRQLLLLRVLLSEAGLMIHPGSACVLDAAGEDAVPSQLLVLAPDMVQGEGHVADC